MTATIVLLYSSYAIPIICLLLRGRSKTLKGPFSLGVVGLIANYGVLAWWLFTAVMYSFPYTKPVRGDNMNYVSCVFVLAVAVVVADWVLRGRTRYKGQETSEKRSGMAAKAKAAGV